MPEPLVNILAQNEADMNADTCCLGQNIIPIAYTNRSANVYPYNKAYEPIENVPIVSAATAYSIIMKMGILIFWYFMNHYTMGQRRNTAL